MFIGLPTVGGQDRAEVMITERVPNLLVSRLRSWWPDRPSRSRERIRGRVPRPECGYTAGSEEQSGAQNSGDVMQSLGLSANGGLEWTTFLDPALRRGGVVAKMKGFGRVRNYCRLLVSLVLAMTAATVSCAQGGANNTGQNTVPGAVNTITHNEPPSDGEFWTPGKIRAAKPMPLPSIGAPLVPQPTRPVPDNGPTGMSPSSPGGPVQH
jgi:hypothetical protein